ncbi:hypothetical protein ACLKA6_016302 [Drosophila palustris]
MRCESMKKFCYFGLLRNFLKSSSLIEKYPDLVIPHGMMIDEILTRFEYLYSIERLVCDQQSRRYLLVGTCIILLINGPILARTSMCTLVKNVLSLLDCKNPMSVHILVEFLLEELGKLKADSKLNLLNLSEGLVRITKVAMPISICLLWAIVGRIMKMEITMHRYREFEELALSLGWKPEYSLCQMNAEQREDLDLMLRSINHLIKFLLLDNNDELQEFGYPNHFFQMRGIDLKSMVTWATFIKTDVSAPFKCNAKICSRIREMLGMLERVKREVSMLPEIVEEKPKGFPPLPVDTFSALDD